MRADAGAVRDALRLRSDMKAALVAMGWTAEEVAEIEAGCEKTARRLMGE